MVASVPDAISSGLIEVPPDRVEVMTAQAGRAGLAQLTRAAEIVNAGLDQMREPPHRGCCSNWSALRCCCPGRLLTNYR